MENILNNSSESGLERLNRNNNISGSDCIVLRELAKRVNELANRPIEEENRKLWYAHNDLKTKQPIAFCDPENGWHEIITDVDIKCINPLAREWEYRLKKEIFWAEIMRDNRVTSKYFDIPYVYADSGWGLDKRIIESDFKDGAISWEIPLKSYDMMDKLIMPQYVFDKRASDEKLNLAKEIFGDILIVRQRQDFWWSLGLTLNFIDIRGLENLMFDMYDHPNEVHALMEHLMKGWIGRIDWLQREGYLSSNNGNIYVGSGGYGFTNDLPKNDESPAAPMDMWGFCESQETVGVSPSMFKEFIFPYQLEIMKKFGLNCYGCCEPVDKRWDVLKTIPRLRRVSVSPWADIHRMAEYLGNDYIFSWKANPAFLAASNPDWSAVRSQIREVVRVAKDCSLEIIMKDNHTINNRPENVIDWCRIANEEINR